MIDEALRFDSPFKTDDDVVHREVVYGREKARLDFCLEGKDRRFYLEVKSVTLSDGPGKAAFPDAKTTRGHKHLRTLMEAVGRTSRSVGLLCFANRFSRDDHR